MIKSSFFSLFILSLALLLDGVGIVKLTIFAAILHECGHILAYILLLKKIPVIRFSISGISMQFPQQQQKNEVLIIISGPLVNFIICALCYVYIVQVALTSFSLVFFMVNLVLGVLNSLPISFLDGGRLIITILPIKFHRLYYIISNILSVVFIAFLGACTVFLKVGALQKIMLCCFICYFLIKSYKDKLH